MILGSRFDRAHLVGTTKTRPKALPLPARHERGEGRGEGFVYSFDVVPGASFVIRLVVPAKCAPIELQPPEVANAFRPRVLLPRDSAQRAELTLRLGIVR